MVIRCKEEVFDFVDTNEVFERIGVNDKDTLEKLLSDFYLDYVGKGEEVIDLLGKNKYEDALNIVYLIKGASGNLSMKKLYEDTLNLELAIKTYVDGNIFIALPHFAETLKSILSMFNVEDEGKALGELSSIIVIIDKDTLSGDIISRMFNDKGHETLVFNEPLEGLCELNRIIKSGRKIKCVVTEIAQPAGCGLDIVKYIRKLNTEYRIPIIISSAISDKFVIGEVRKADIDGYILKPFNRKLILERFKKFNCLN
ncbi:MAG: response regulator [Clostridium sp.]